MDQTFEKRKKVIYDFICDDLLRSDENQRDCRCASDPERAERRTEGSAG